MKSVQDLACQIWIREAAISQVTHVAGSLFDRFKKYRLLLLQLLQFVFNVCNGAIQVGYDGVERVLLGFDADRCRAEQLVYMTVSLARDHHMLDTVLKSAGSFDLQLSLSQSHRPVLPARLPSLS